ncbi:MAG TPA: hypothetical protein VID77_01905 [Stellaceae bacterium]
MIVVETFDGGRVEARPCVLGRPPLDVSALRAISLFLFDPLVALNQPRPQSGVVRSDTPRAEAVRMETEALLQARDQFRVRGLPLILSLFFLGIRGRRIHHFAEHVQHVARCHLLRLSNHGVRERHAKNGKQNDRSHFPPPCPRKSASATILPVLRVFLRHNVSGMRVLASGQRLPSEYTIVG